MGLFPLFFESLHYSGSLRDAVFDDSFSIGVSIHQLSGERKKVTVTHQRIETSEFQV